MMLLYPASNFEINCDKTIMYCINETSCHEDHCKYSS